MTTEQPTGYSTLQITLHWAIALLVLFQLVFGESMTTVIDAAEEGTVVSATDQFLASAHYWVGIAVLALLIVRVIVRLATGAPKSSATGWMAMAAAATHGLFYILLVAVPTTGLLAIYVSDEFGDIHEIGKPVFIVLIALHAVAALYHQFVLKDGTLKKMMSSAR